MIGKREWFKRRKYTGWGFSPATWQGWAYIFVAILPYIILGTTKPVDTIRLVVLIIWSIIIVIDFIDIITHLPKDERDRIHEAMAERNALWVIISVLAIGIIYQASSSVNPEISKVDPIILIAIFAGLLAKIISNVYFDKKD